MQKLVASAVARANAANPRLLLFAKLLALEDGSPPQSNSQRPFYRRAWCPQIPLWYLIWQRLSPQHTLVAALADALRPGPKPLSVRLRSNATTALAKARALASGLGRAGLRAPGPGLGRAARAPAGWLDVAPASARRHFQALPTPSDAPPKGLLVRGAHRGVLWRGQRAGAGRPVGFDPLERAGAGRALDPGGATSGCG